MFNLDSPVDCKIYLKYKNGSSYEMTELLMAQVFNYKISENKRPIYGFNKTYFEQVVRGKKLFEGIIAIKKSIISDINKIINITPSFINNEKEYTNNKLEYLKNTLSDDESIKSLLYEYEKIQNEEYQFKVRSAIKDYSIDVLNDLPEDTKLIIAFGSYKTTDSFKEEYNNMINKGKELTSKELESLIINNSDFVIEDINFFEKTGEINISKNDIDEVYKFFGNVKSKN